MVFTSKRIMEMTKREKFLKKNEKKKKKIADFLNMTSSKKWRG